jgi:hypothetical protein
LIMTPAIIKVKRFGSISSWNFPRLVFTWLGKGEHNLIVNAEVNIRYTKRRFTHSQKNLCTIMATICLGKLFGHKRLSVP